MEYQQLIVDKVNKVACCRILNPPMNFMNQTTISELDHLIRDLETDDRVRAVIFTGAIPDIFITHYDVGELSFLASLGKPAEMPKVADMLGPQMQNRLQALPKPTIAAINGACGGGGCEFALCCDIRIMAIGDFSIGQPEVSVGIIPGGGGTQRLPRLIGQGKALEMLLLGKAVGAEEAERIGLVHQAVPATELLSTAFLLASRLAHGATVAQGLIKRCVYKGNDLPLQEGLQMEAEAFLESLASEDAQTAMKSYLTGKLFEFSGH